MLMDEPIGALDAKLREEMRTEIKRLHLKQGSTTIYVTHDQIEAMSLADRIVVMHEGVLQQVGSPEEVYAYPTNMFVARFVGSPVMNIVDVGWQATMARHALRSKAPSRVSPFRQSCSASSMPTRPTAIWRSASVPRVCWCARTRPTASCRSRRTSSSQLGAYDIVDLQVGSQMLRARTRAVMSGGRRPRFCRVDPSQAHFFDTASGNSLGVRL